MIRDFNKYTMIGITVEDNEVIMNCLDNDIELTVDENGRVWNSGGQWIADYTDTEIGSGLAC